MEGAISSCLHGHPFRPLFVGHNMKDIDMEKSGNKPANKPAAAPTHAGKGKPAETSSHTSGAHADKHDKDTNAKHAQKK